MLAKMTHTFAIIMKKTYYLSSFHCNKKINWINILIIAWRYNFFVKSLNFLNYRCWTRAASNSFAESSNLFFLRKLSQKYTLRQYIYILNRYTLRKMFWLYQQKVQIIRILIIWIKILVIVIKILVISTRIFDYKYLYFSGWIY